MSRFLARYEHLVTVMGDQPHHCWEWSGSRNNFGYGKVTVKGHKVYAHRLAYVMDVGPIDDGEVVAHVACDNPPCVRPSHLKATDQADNLRDGWSKGRIKRRRPI